MTVTIGRRELLAALGGAAAAWPLAARAQQPAMPVIGFLSGRSRDEAAYALAAFHSGLKETGFVEGQNVAVEYRWAEGQEDRLPALAADLVRRHVTAIAATGGSASVLAAKTATTTIPIVFLSGADPVKLGLIANFNRPEGNATGTYVFTTATEGKRLALLRDLVPTAQIVGVLVRPRSANATIQLNNVEGAARAVGQQIHIFHANSAREIDTVFAKWGQAQTGALMVLSDAFFNSRRYQLTALAAHYAIPAIYELREFALAGGLMSYGPSLTDGYRQVGVYTGQILKGAKPADLPVVQSTKFEFVINLKTAKELGIKISDNLLSIADEVIE
jgi:putative ABC transport system substrate-binding protein